MGPFELADYVGLDVNVFIGEGELSLFIFPGAWGGHQLFIYL